jgi:hypothetical protein
MVTKLLIFLKYFNNLKIQFLNLTLLHGCLRFSLKIKALSLRNHDK